MCNFGPKWMHTSWLWILCSLHVDNRSLNLDVTLMHNNRREIRLGRFSDDGHFGRTPKSRRYCCIAMSCITLHCTTQHRTRLRLAWEGQVNPSNNEHMLSLIIMSSRHSEHLAAMTDDQIATYVESDAASSSRRFLLDILRINNRNSLKAHTIH